MALGSLRPIPNEWTRTADSWGGSSVVFALFAAIQIFEAYAKEKGRCFHAPFRSVIQLFPEDHSLTC